MSSLEVWLIIILVLGVIASNLAVLKYSNKFKLPPFGKPKPEDKSAKQQSVPKHDDASHLDGKQIDPKHRDNAADTDKRDR
ncbi:DUF2897 family protein [Shewanella sp.]|uniref:DUF2897 family protein n=1 Tax=Shewanella sp. TaxID=50422 RepID=UPI003D0E5BC0